MSLEMRSVGATRNHEPRTKAEGRAKVKSQKSRSYPEASRKLFSTCCPGKMQIGTGRCVMGVTYIEATVTGPTGKRETVQFLVDSGATYTLLPEEVWKAIGLIPKREIVFTLADGTTVDRKVSECHIALPEGEGHTPVILGEPRDEALLGVVTLEILGLILNPFTRELHPMRMLLV